MEEFNFIGRTRILEDLQEELGKPSNAVDAHRFMAIYGAPGVGKTALLNELWRTLDSGAQPHLWLKISDLKNIDSGARAREALTKGLLANRDEHKRTVQTFAREAGRVALSGFDANEAENAELPAEQSSSDGSDIDFSKQTARKSEKTRIWVQLLEDYFVFNNLADMDGGFVQKPRITIVLDGLDGAHDEFKRWVSREFMPLLFYESKRKDLRLIVTGCDPNMLKQIKLPIGERPIDMTIEPFTVGEIQGMLEKRGLSPDKDLVVYNRTRGLPAEVAQEIQAMVSQKYESELSTVVSKVFRSKEPEQQLWMVQAAYLPFISRESLMLFHSASDAARVSSFILKNTQFIEDKLSRGGNHMIEYYAAFVREYFQRNEPEKHLELIEKVSAFKSICDNIPREDSRLWLSRLSICDHLNEGLLKQLYPKQFRKVKQILDRDRSYFIKTKFNLKISPRIYEDIVDYRELLSVETDSAVRSRLNKIWKTTEEKIQDEITDLQNSIEQEKKKVNRTNQDLSKLKEQLEAINEKAEMWRKRRKPKRNLSERVQGNRLMSAIVCEIVGILIMYFSVLFQGPHTIPMSAVALLVMVYGLSMPYARRERVLAAAVANTTPNPFETDESQQKIRMLSLRASDLVNQRSLQNSRIVKLRRALQEKDEVLQEPYT